MPRSHVCIENSMHQNCPVCFEFLFESIKPINVMPCGHTIHQVCDVHAPSYGMNHTCLSVCCPLAAVAWTHYMYQTPCNAPMPACLPGMSLPETVLVDLPAVSSVPTGYLPTLFHALSPRPASSSWPNTRPTSARSAPKHTCKSNGWLHCLPLHSGGRRCH